MAIQFNLYWSLVSGTGVAGTKIPNVTSPYDHLGLSVGVPYYYVVTTYDTYSSLESGPSAEVSATPLEALYEENITLSQESTMTQTIAYTKGNFDDIFLEKTYNDVLQQLLDNFTPEMVRQYQESILFKSFIEALAEVIAEAKLEINRSIKELNIQQATTLFLNLWAGVTGLSRKNINGIAETDNEYRKRLLDSIFWDKVSNNAMKKAVLLKLGIGTTVSDRSIAVSLRDVTNAFNFISPTAFIDTLVSAKYLSNIVEVSLDGQIPTDQQMVDVYNEITSLLAVGNIIGSITRNITLSFLDVNSVFNRVSYGPIFMQAEAVSGSVTTESTNNLGQFIYLDNQYDMNSGKYFNGNIIPDDIVTISFSAGWHITIPI